jgi:hypothetical protein
MGIPYGRLKRTEINYFSIEIYVRQVSLPGFKGRDQRWTYLSFPTPVGSP